MTGNKNADRQVRELTFIHCISLNTCAFSAVSLPLYARGYNVQVQSLPKLSNMNLYLIQQRLCRLGNLAGVPDVVDFCLADVFEIGEEIGNRIFFGQFLLVEHVVNSVNKHEGDLVYKSPCFHGVIRLQIYFVLFQQVLQKIKALFHLAPGFV